ncbi:hypothetical protein Taro_002825, partial [Colocasia esculenta]|nr:hypothetical protein [Colocasia esculenta]
MVSLSPANLPRLRHRRAEQAITAPPLPLPAPLRPVHGRSKRGQKTTGRAPSPAGLVPPRSPDDPSPRPPHPHLVPPRPRKKQTGAEDLRPRAHAARTPSLRPTLASSRPALASPRPAPSCPRKKQTWAEVRRSCALSRRPRTPTQPGRPRLVLPHPRLVPPHPRLVPPHPRKKQTGAEDRRPRTLSHAARTRSPLSRLAPPRPQKKQSGQRTVGLTLSLRRPGTLALALPLQRKGKSGQNTRHAPSPSSPDSLSPRPFRPQVHKNFVKGQHPTWSDDRIQLEQHNKFVGWFRDYVDQLREQMTLPEEVTCLARGVISQRSTVQQPHVNDRRPSRLHAQESVISQRSTVQQPHVNDRRPSRLHAQETVISQRSTVQHPTNMADVTRFCEFSISSKLKEWRATLKRAGYMEGVDGELSVMPPNERISEQSWNLLLQYWKNSKKKREKERNKKNRVADQATHTLGAKSIARHNYEQQQKLGDNYSTLEAYVAAHKMKSGEYPNAYIHTICEKVIAACEEKNLTNSSDPSILTPILDDVYNGHHGGYERGRGLGWSRGAWRHNMSSEASNEN